MNDQSIQISTDMTTSLAKFEAAREKINTFAEQCKLCIVNSNETHDAARKLAMDAGKIEKIIEDKRKELTKPLVDAKRQVDDFVKDLTAQLNTSKSELRNRILEYEQAQERIRQEEIRKAEAERRRIEDERRKIEAELLKQAAETKELDPFLVEQINELKEKEIEAVSTPIISEAPKSNIRRTWEWELSDITKVPVAYLMPDPDKIKEAIRNGARDIPGIRIYQKETLSLR